jgi:monoamine oxidase
MTDGTRQICEFDPDLYWNAGPSRIPSAHQAVLGYCRELGVGLEVLVNTSRGALIHNPQANGGRPIEMRQAHNDTRGAAAIAACRHTYPGEKSSGKRCFAISPRPCF